MSHGTPRAWRKRRFIRHSVGRVLPAEFNCVLVRISCAYAASGADAAGSARSPVDQGSRSGSVKA